MKQSNAILLRALIGAFESREIYGEAHPTARGALDHCCETLQSMVRGDRAITLALVRGGVLVEEMMISEAWAIQAPFVVSLRDAGVHLVRILSGAAAGDLVWLLQSAREFRSPASPSGRVLLGRAGDSGGAPAGDEAGLPSASDPDELRSVWSTVATGRGDRRTAGMAAKIVAASAQSRISLVPLMDLKKHDEYTFVHVTNVAILASALGEVCGLGGAVLQGLTEAALLHDLGKWNIPGAILTKSGKLDPAELALVRQHPAIGAMMLAGTPGVSDVAVIVAYEHHQRIDGKGYPQAARSRPPSLLSQTVQIADIYDALRSHRPYRAGYPEAQCLEIMEKEAGKSFDRELYRAFCERVLTRVSGGKQSGGERSGLSEAA
jgi:HD-GYP domain-containing protein (c-di-GMP phosphodiesterase class II)